MKTDPQNSDYIVESGATRNFEPWRAEDEETDEMKKKREAEEMGDAMKSLENRTLDSKREMDILAALDEMKSMKVYPILSCNSKCILQCINLKAVRCSNC
jgi:hypothetical protein